MKIDHIQLAIPEKSEPLCRIFWTEILGFEELEKPENLRGRGGAGHLGEQHGPFNRQAVAAPVKLGVVAQEGVEAVQGRVELLVEEVEDVERDLLIGFWMGWFIWLAYPAYLSQGVAAMIMTGGWSYFFGPLMLIANVLMAGALVLIIRLVASWGGPLSRAFGSFGSGPFSQALGWALVPISLWCLANSIIDAQNIGLF